MKPRIGITTSCSDDKQSLNINYIRAVEGAGGLPLIVPLLETEEATHAFAALLDGLIITGGPGITDGLVGELPDDLPPVDAIRSTSEQHIYRALNKQPVLGICYGMQFINAQAGGTLFADVSVQQANSLNHSKQRGASSHPVHIMPNTNLHRILQSQHLVVNTHHIQGLQMVGRGLHISATAPDGVIEAIESADGRLLGVQFHPERMGAVMQPLFDDFIERCRKFTRFH